MIKKFKRKINHIIKPDLETTYLRMLLGYMLFFWAFFTLITHNWWAQLLLLIVKSLTSPRLFNISIVGNMAAAVLGGLVLLFPAIAGPIAFTCWGKKFRSFRILIAHFIIAFFFLAGRSIFSNDDQWLHLKIIFTFQLWATGAMVSDSSVFSFIVFVLLVWASCIGAYDSLFVNIVVSLYLLVSSVIILVGLWKIEPEDESYC